MATIEGLKGHHVAARGAAREVGVLMRQPLAIRCRRIIGGCVSQNASLQGAIPYPSLDAATLDCAAQQITSGWHLTSN
ncbi:MAG: hypothetical protein ACT4P6_15900 [Gemmatimonadaceae bacterium]